MRVFYIFTFDPFGNHYEKPKNMQLTPTKVCFIQEESAGGRKD